MYAVVPEGRLAGGRFFQSQRVGHNGFRAHLWEMEIRKTALCCVSCSGKRTWAVCCLKCRQQGPANRFSVNYALVVFVVQVVSLERFQSLQDKMHLLDKAVEGHDGNIITAVGLLRGRHHHHHHRHHHHHQRLDFDNSKCSLHFRY